MGTVLLPTAPSSLMPSFPILLGSEQHYFESSARNPWSSEELFTQISNSPEERKIERGLSYFSLDYILKLT